MVLIVFGPPRRRFKVSFVKKSKKLKKLILSKIFAHFGNFWILDDFRKKYMEISCILTNYSGSPVLQVLCFSLSPTPKH